MTSRKGTSRPASSNYALDDQYVYWTTGAGQLVRVSRGGGNNPAPTPLSPSVPISTSLYYDLKVTATHFIWIEQNYAANTSRLVRVPRAGGAAETLSLSGVARDVDVDAAGVIYFLRAGTLTRAMAQGGSFATAEIGTPTKTSTFTLSGDSVFWIEATTTANQYRALRSTAGGACVGDPHLQRTHGVVLTNRAAPTVNGPRQGSFT